MKFIKFFRYLRKNGVSEGLKHLWRYLSQFSDLEVFFIQKKREALSAEFVQNYGLEVRHGYLAGMSLWQGDSRGNTDMPSMILGFYEKEVLDIIIENKAAYSCFVNIGSADGYYSVGLLKNRFFDYAICFEIAEHLREVTLAIAQKNEVSKNLIVHGKASDNFVEVIINDGLVLSDCLILCDIEGGEFDIFTSQNLYKLRHSFIIIEVHDFLVENGLEKYETLVALCAPYFTVQEVFTGSRDLSSFNEIKSLPDTDRWLLCSEGRMQSMRWLVLKPLN